MDNFDRDFDRRFSHMTTQFDRDFNRMKKAAVVIWVVSALLGLAVTGVIIWAIIMVVGSLT